MSADNNLVAARAAPLSTSAWFRHLVGGGGGSRAILAIAALVYALDRAGFDFSSLETIGGISGGAFPTLMLANGMRPAPMVLNAINSDFTSLLTQHGNKAELLFALLLRYRYESLEHRPHTYIFSSEKAADYLDTMVPVWPKAFWTMATHEDKQVLFTAEGVFLCSHDGTCVKLCDKPAKVSDAVRGSIAVPGFIKAHEWNGLRLYDSVLSWDGLCPVGTVLRNLGADAKDVVACDVRSQNKGAIHTWLKARWVNILGGLDCSKEDRSPRRYREQGTMLVEPDLNKFGSLKFRLTEEEKWEAVISAFHGTAASLRARGLIDAGKFVELGELANNPSRFMRECKERG